MQQEHSFFSNPQVYFGSPHNVNHNDDDSDDEWDFSDPWRIFLQNDLIRNQQIQTGLVIHWIHLNE